MKKGMAYLTTFMGFLYITIGGYVLLAKSLVSPFNGPAKYALGALMIMYGAFRLYSVYQKRKGQEQ